MPDLETEDLKLPSNTLRASRITRCLRHEDLDRCSNVSRDSHVDSSNYAVSAVAIRDLGLRDAKDKGIFEAARQEKAVVMTKDSDFLILLDKVGPPPPVIWVTCGNTSNARLEEVLTNTLLKALDLLNSSEKLVEINAA
jgi:predicted nuclease of predicted toxin-antitoxin system